MRAAKAAQPRAHARAQPTRLRPCGAPARCLLPPPRMPLQPLRPRRSRAVSVLAKRKKPARPRAEPRVFGRAESIELTLALGRARDWHGVAALYAGADTDADPPIHAVNVAALYTNLARTLRDECGGGEGAGSSGGGGGGGGGAGGPQAWNTARPAAGPGARRAHAPTPAPAPISSALPPPLLARVPRPDRSDVEALLARLSLTAARACESMRGRELATLARAAAALGDASPWLWDAVEARAAAAAAALDGRALAQLAYSLGVGAMHCRAAGAAATASARSRGRGDGGSSGGNGGGARRSGGADAVVGDAVWAPSAARLNALLAESCARLRASTVRTLLARSLLMAPRGNSSGRGGSARGGSQRGGGGGGGRGGGPATAGGNGGGNAPPEFEFDRRSLTNLLYGVSLAASLCADGPGNDAALLLAGSDGGGGSGGLGAWVRAWCSRATPYLPGMPPSELHQCAVALGSLAEVTGRRPASAATGGGGGAAAGRPSSGGSDGGDRDRDDGGDGGTGATSSGGRAVSPAAARGAPGAAGAAARGAPHGDDGRGAAGGGVLPPGPWLHAYCLSTRPHVPHMGLRQLAAACSLLVAARHHPGQEWAAAAVARVGVLAAGIEAAAARWERQAGADAGAGERAQLRRLPQLLASLAWLCRGCLPQPPRLPDGEGARCLRALLLPSAGRAALPHSELAAARRHLHALTADGTR
ncbi:hypothetical protein FOA52_001261 [Chlamydomonas sp. UWO 241]|nr:hypothetical protein FOA52_001261 [Chlamydomonas sp. UWO 241]